MASKYLRLLRTHPIVRRYIIMNSFDGALTILGIVIVSFLAGVRDAGIVVLPSVGAAVAMCVSGVWGAYAAEMAELKHSIRELESHMFKKLKGTRYQRKKEQLAMFIALVDGISPLLASIFVVLPFFAASLDYIGIAQAYYASFVMVGALLFVLGMLAGKTAKEDVLRHGAVMVLAGVVVGAVFYLLALAGLI